METVPKGEAMASSRSSFVRILSLRKIALIFDYISIAFGDIFLHKQRILSYTGECSSAKLKTQSHTDAQKCGMSGGSKAPRHCD